MGMFRQVEVHAGACTVHHVGCQDAHPGLDAYLLALPLPACSEAYFIFAIVSGAAAGHCCCPPLAAPCMSWALSLQRGPQPLLLVLLRLLMRPPAAAAHRPQGNIEPLLAIQYPNCFGDEEPPDCNQTTENNIQVLGQ